MLLRVFLKMIKPSDSQLRKSGRGKLCTYKVLIYQYFLRRLLETYSRYAIYDTITIGDNVKVMHEFRDIEFEKELQRNKIDCHLKMRMSYLPVTYTKSRHKSHFQYFRFKDLFVLCIDGKDVYIRHDDQYLIDGSLTCKLKCASSKEGLSQSLIELGKMDNKPVKPDKKLKSSGPLFSKDRHITPIPLKASANAEIGKVVEKKPGMVPDPIERRGFEIDSSF